MRNNIELITKSEIAYNLGLYTTGGNLNIPVVTILLRKIDANPYGKKYGLLAYPKCVLSEIRQWIWDQYHGDLPDAFNSGKRRYQVVYYPLPDINDSIA